jgi:succinate-acetate transporter protein
MADQGRPEGKDVSASRRSVVTLRPVGSALPLGLTGLAVASLVLSGFELGWVGDSERQTVAAVLLVAAVPLQLLSSVFALLARDGAAAGATGMMAAAWASTGVVYATTTPGTTSGALGLVLLALGALLAGTVPAQALGKPLLAAVVALAGARFVVNGVYELSAAGAWREVSGALGFAVAAVAAYAVVALELEDARDRPVLPTFRRGVGRRSVSADLDAQVAGVEHEPGVRRQL